MFFSFRPILANHSAPRLTMCVTQASVSTLFTIVGQPKTPWTAGKGGLMRGWPRLPSRLSMRPVSSPQM